MVTQGWKWTGLERQRLACRVEGRENQTCQGRFGPDLEFFDLGVAWSTQPVMWLQLPGLAPCSLFHHSPPSTSLQRDGFVQTWRCSLTPALTCSWPWKLCLPCLKTNDLGLPSGFLKSYTGADSPICLSPSVFPMPVLIMKNSQVAMGCCLIEKFSL